MTGPELVLGTAQFGLPYGVTNTAGQPSLEQCAAMLETAAPQISWLDTSINYGSALDRLGGLPEARPFSIVTKINGQRADDVAREIDQILLSLGRDHVDTVLFHDPKLFFDAVQAAESVAALQHIRAQGKISRVGVSLYGVDDIERCLKVFVPDLMQLPASAADNRLTNAGVLPDLQARGVALHIRSIFLQGLLLQQAESLPKKFRALIPLLNGLDRVAGELGVSRQAACLAAVMGLPGVEALVCGVTTKDELSTLVSAFAEANTIYGSDDLAALIGRFAFEASVLDPRMWTTA